jgi:RND superfamily putative drug exporter
MLATWGTIVHRHRWAVLGLSIVLLLVALIGIHEGVTPSYNPQGISGTESETAEQLLTHQIPAQSGSSLELLYRSPMLTADQPEFEAAVESSVRPLLADPRVRSVLTPYLPGPGSAALVSRDRHQALVIVTLKDTARAQKATYADLWRELGPSKPLQVTGTGGLAIDAAFIDQLGHDLGSATRFSLPITGLLLLLVFGTVVAALLPLGVGGLAVVGGFGATFMLARATNVSQYATDLIALVGLGVGIDYSLFIVSRYREQLARGSSPEQSLRVAMATSGRSVIFSGLAVAVGLSGLLFYQGSYLGTLGLGGTFAVVAAEAFAFTMLPALLAILGPRVDRLRLPLVGRQRGDRGFWHRLASLVMRRPLPALLPVLAILGMLAYPVADLQLGSGGLDLLPPQNPARWAYQQIADHFPQQGQEEMSVVLDYPSGDPLSGPRAAYASRLAATVSRFPGVLSVDDPAAPTASPALRQLGIGAHIVVLTIHSRYVPSSPQAKSLLARLRAQPGPPGGRKLVTGITAFTQDEVSWIEARSVPAVAFVLAVTYLVLLGLTGSLVLPLKAVVMNLISLGATFGAIVWVFQQGHLSGPLDFTPQTLDPTIAVLIFCMLFGLSMDYEVLMLNRIREEWRRTGATEPAVAFGLERSGRLITGAAAIMVAVFASFGLTAGTVLIKALGLGLAIAITVDASLVRAIVVPAVMRLLGRVNWWAPGPLARLWGRTDELSAEQDIA